ncbi:hypothetical protein KIPB_013498, partial [Kipferlia bialata]
DHPIEKTAELVMACKKCKKIFRLDTEDFDPESDAFCPNCDNEWFIEAETPEDRMQMRIEIEGAEDGTMDSEMIRDERDAGKERRRMRH